MRPAGHNVLQNVRAGPVRPFAGGQTVQQIVVRAGQVSLKGALNDSRTAREIRSRLPVSGTGSRWGDEVYFSTDIDLPPEDPAEVVEAGDIGYWPPGRAICIFWGPTPASRGSEIRPASPVNVIGRVEGDPGLLAAVRDGDRVSIEPA